MLISLNKFGTIQFSEKYNDKIVEVHDYYDADGVSVLDFPNIRNVSLHDLDNSYNIIENSDSLLHLKDKYAGDDFPFSLSCDIPNLKYLEINAKRHLRIPDYSNLRQLILPNATEISLGHLPKLEVLYAPNAKLDVHSLYVNKVLENATNNYRFILEKKLEGQFQFTSLDIPHIFRRYRPGISGPVSFRTSNVQITIPNEIVKLCIGWRGFDLSDITMPNLEELIIYNIYDYTFGSPGNYGDRIVEIINMEKPMNLFPNIRHISTKKSTELCDSTKLLSLKDESKNGCILYNWPNLEYLEIKKSGHIEIPNYPNLKYLVLPNATSITTESKPEIIYAPNCVDFPF